MKIIELTPKGSKETTVLIGEIEELADEFSTYCQNLIQNPQVVRGVDGDIAVDVVFTILNWCGSVLQRPLSVPTYEER